jgi:hypothetical protein
VALGRRAAGSKKGAKAGKRNELAKLDATPPWETRIRDEPEATIGPWDERDAPDDDVPRADLGSLRIPVASGLDLQVEVGEQDHQVVAATLGSSAGTMQLMLFAAPRNEGIWDDVRAEIAESLTQQRGRPAERDGAFGTELTGTISNPGGGRMPVRFIGIDGPRWMLRATLLGPAADPERAELFEEALRQVVVVRGTEPLPVRDPVPLTLPKDVVLPDELSEG